MKTILESEMPAPETMVRRADGSEIAAMFYFAAAEQNLGDIAGEQGFECRSYMMEEDFDEDHPLIVRHFEGDQTALNEWTPTSPDGWQFAAKLDTEDGGCALFIRRMAEAKAS